MPTTPRKSTATKSTTPATDAAETPAATESTTRKHLDPAAVVVTEVSESTGANPFARGSKDIPEDHPVVKAFDLSWENKKVLFLATPDPANLVKLLRKVAAQRDLGVRVAPTDTGVHFEAKTKRARKVAAPAE